jgi:hypothetical protein
MQLGKTKSDNPQDQIGILPNGVHVGFSWARHLKAHKSSLLTHIIPAMIFNQPRLIMLH